MYVDSYCERTAPGLLNEPLNAATNLAFLLASAVLLWLLSGQRRRAPASVWALPVLLGVVGLCSLAFHTFATSLTGGLDSASIVLFILTGTVVTVHWMWGVPWRWAWLAAPAYLGVAAGVGALLYLIGGDRAVLGGYVPALLSLILFGLAVRYTGAAPARRYGQWLLLAGAVFAVSLTLRTLDDPLCASVPIGTHFLWHCFNAVVLFIVAYAVIRRWQDVATTANGR